MARKAKPPLKEIHDLSDIPENMREKEAAEFWSTHSLGETLLEQMERAEGDPDLPPVRPRKSISTSIRLDVDVARRLKALARRKGKGYQTLLKEFVLERLYEEEKRENIL